MLPVNNFSRVVDKFLFPYLSKSDFDLSKLKSIYLKWVSAMSYAFVPIMFGVIFFSEDFVHVVFNPKWFEMVDMMRVIAIAGIFIAFAEINTSFLLKLNKAKELFRINLMSRIIIILGVVFTVKQGVIPVAYSLVVTNFLRFIFVHFYIFQKLQFSLRKYFQAALLPILLSSFSIFFILSLLKLFLVQHSELRLFFSIILFPISYLLLSNFFNSSCQKMIYKGIFNIPLKNN
jgi:O-antigen/teichoic acid export membrane protein